MGYFPVTHTRDKEGLPIVMGTVYALIKGQCVVLNLVVCPSTSVCVVYCGGWDQSHMIGGVDGDACCLSVMKRSWFRSEVLLTWQGDPVMFKTSNVLGDILRNVFGSDSYS